ncbi:aminomethyl-transferring glycine dehydrogenase subunit GcvPA [Deinococcus sp. QL22]|uniref:aminomethyl-transferring glycine dehydrogenase subunit GcvPA n=1 Tax=Deinococcus sp. QL22 TaxID=2939437 RepID=UPI0020178480|nr:aminomethyl-transferring glycine dehydrogenase subunit GcvPA [Deinococcus sp. QL22]UQN08150.1 aminomethyl-transferring glycine dehydrogenase subunit GcvPA [Deinococcus sp. QL22]
MLTVIGKKRVDDLFAHLPGAVRNTPSSPVPALSELELTSYMTELAQRNTSPNASTNFLGAGAYNHHVPAAVWALAGRGEFLTAYTPYQAELMQGWLQALHEYQEMVQALTGMAVANASMYDGATATFEAVKVAMLATSRYKVIVSRTVDPRYRDVLHTLLTPIGAVVTELPHQDGVTQLNEGDLQDAAALVVQSPNFLGLIEDVAELAVTAHQHGTLIIQVITDPTSLGLLKAPGEMNVDLVAAEGQALGNPVSFGGPHLGILAGRAAFVRLMPGRLVSKGFDAQGQPGYVLTLQTREQHVRREKASSNICTNQSLNALAAAIYLALLGPVGVQEVAELSAGAAAYARTHLERLPGFTLPFSGPHHHELVVQTPVPTQELLGRLRQMGVQGGYPLHREYPELGQALLFCFTEQHAQADIDHLIRCLRDATA